MKKLILFTFSAIFALHIQVSHAADDSTDNQGATGTEECVIRDGQ